MGGSFWQCQPSHYLLSLNPNPHTEKLMEDNYTALKGAITSGVDPLEVINHLKGITGGLRPETSLRILDGYAEWASAHFRAQHLRTALLGQVLDALQGVEVAHV